jgi:aromatic ring-cleaving dioxygenase
MIRRPENVYEHYHAHVYFDERTTEHAKGLCLGAGERFGVRVGRFHHRPVGPHPYWSCQLTFDSKQFAALIPWLDAHRQGLDILVHGLTGDGLNDHTAAAMWLGDPAPLDLTQFMGPAKDED